MAIITIASSFALKGYNPNEKALLLALAANMDWRTHRTFVSIDTLAEHMEVSKGTVISTKKSLAKKGAISITKRKGSDGRPASDYIDILDDRLRLYIYRDEPMSFEQERVILSGSKFKPLHDSSGSKFEIDTPKDDEKSGLSGSKFELSGSKFEHYPNNNLSNININNNYIDSNQNLNPSNDLLISNQSETNKPSKTKTDISNISLKAKKELSNNCPPSSVAPPKFYDETSGDELWAYIQNDDSGISIGTLKTMCQGYGTFLKRNYKIEPTVDNLKAIVNRFCKWKADSEVSTVFNPAKAFKEMTKSTNTFEFFAAELNRADKPSSSGGQKGSSSKTELKTTYKGDSQMPIYLVSHYEQGIPVLKERPEPAIASKAENRPYIFEGVYYARNLMLLNKLKADNDIPPFSHIPARCQTIEDKERWLINQDSTDDLKI